MHTGFYSENLKGRDLLEDLGKDKSIILKWILRKYVSVWTWLIWLRIETCDEVLRTQKWIFGFYKGGKFLDHLNHYLFLKKDSAPGIYLSVY
jgi:hypothetical protein